MSKTPDKRGAIRSARFETPSSNMNSSAEDAMMVEVTEGDTAGTPRLRRSVRKRSPQKKFIDYVIGDSGQRKRRAIPDERLPQNDVESSDDDEMEGAKAKRPDDADIQLLQTKEGLAGKSLYGFNTPKKRNGMALAALNTPKTPKTPKTTKSTKQSKTPDIKRRKSTIEPKTPSHVRRCVKNQIAKLLESDSDFSGSDSEFVPTDDDSGSSSDAEEADDDEDADAADDEPKTPRKGRRDIIVPVLPKTPSAARSRQSARCKKSSVDYVPESDCYFQAHASTKIHTSDHTLDRLKNPRLPAEHLFKLLADMKISDEHEESINAMIEEYRTYFHKWLYIMHEGFSVLLFGLGSKRQLLQLFHRELLTDETVLVVNGYFPSLTLKDILDSIMTQILQVGNCPANPHEAVDMIEEELAFDEGVELYLIVHNLDGIMLRNTKMQTILARLASLPKIHLIASIDYINTPLLWDHTRLSNFNFSWWDCTTMLPYSEETAYENSLLVQNSGELALSSMRSVFSSLTTNSRGIYMVIVKYQLKHKDSANYQGMPFKDLYWSCREAFLVSSDLALRAQLTEFIDHKLVKTKRHADGTEMLIIPIDAVLLQQFLEEQEKK